MNSDQYQDEELRRMFRRLPEESLSPDFSFRVMAQVMSAPQHNSKTAHVGVYIAVACIAVTSGIGIFLAFRYFDFQMIGEYFMPVRQSMRSSFSAAGGLFTGGDADKIILIGVSVLMLLLGDLFIRRHIERRNAASCENYKPVQN